MTQQICCTALCIFAEKDWDDIKFGVDNKVDFYAVSFVKDAQVVHELKNYLKSKQLHIYVVFIKSIWMLINCLTLQAVMLTFI